MPRSLSHPDAPRANARAARGGRRRGPLGAPGESSECGLKPRDQPLGFLLKMQIPRPLPVAATRARREPLAFGFIPGGRCAHVTAAHVTAAGGGEAEELHSLPLPRWSVSSLMGGEGPGAGQAKGNSEGGSLSPPGPILQPRATPAGSTASPGLVQPEGGREAKLRTCQEGLMEAAPPSRGH